MGLRVGRSWVSCSELMLAKREVAPVSVVIPCYQAALTIGRALASVSAQSCRPYEVIVVDDGSDDDTLKVLSGLVKEYGESWLKVFYLTRNQGPATARNYGWERASQPWIAFLDADDSWHVDKIALQLEFMESHPEFTLSGHLCSNPRTSLSWGLQAHFLISECSLIRLCFSNSLRTQTVMLRRNIALRFPAGRCYAEDYHLWLSILAADGRAAVICQSLTTLHKPAFGAGGQSGALWCMEKGELEALLAVRRQGRISFSTFAGAVSWSLLKFIRRLLITGFRRSLRVMGFPGKSMANDLNDFEGRSVGQSSPGQKQTTILFLVTDDWFFLLHRRALAEAALAAGFRVLVATAPGPRVAEITALGFLHYPLKMRRASRNPIREVIGFFDLVGLYRRLKPDIVHQVSIKPIIYGSLAARLAGVPAVVNAVTGLGFVFIAGGRCKKYLKSIIETAYRLVGNRATIRFLFENPDDRHHFLVHKIVEPERAILILGSGVGLERFQPQPSEREAEVPIVLLAARMLWHKGIKEFVEAARVLRAKGLKAEFWLAGMPDMSNPAAVPISRLLYWHRQGSVRWLGFQKDMPALYQQVAIVCLPTRYREGIPVALLEGAACGKPLVATEMPGCREIVHDGDNGFLVPPGNQTALAEALEKLLLDPVLRHRFGLYGRSLVEERFSSTRVISETFAVYKELLGDKWEPLVKS